MITIDTPHFLFMQRMVSIVLFSMISFYYVYFIIWSLYHGIPFYSADWWCFWEPTTACSLGLTWSPQYYGISLGRYIRRALSQDRNWHYTSFWCEPWSIRILISIWIFLKETPEGPLGHGSSVSWRLTQWKCLNVPIYLACQSINVNASMDY